MADRPNVIVLSGPNGAGKSTAASRLLPGDMMFVNADEVAKTVSSYPSQAAHFQAGRVVLELMERLELHRSDFALETTLSGRSLASRLARLREIGYRVRLIFIFLPDPKLSIERVAGRVRLGGHSVPEETIRRRYVAGLRNFFSLYQRLADRWAVYDTMNGVRPRLIAVGRLEIVERIRQPVLWKLMRGLNHA